MDRKEPPKADVPVRARHLRLITVGGVDVTGRGASPKQYGGISAALDTLLSHEAGGRTVSSDSEEAQRLLKIGGRLRELAEQCLDPAAPALERLGRTVELSGRRRLLAVVSDLQRPSGAA